MDDTGYSVLYGFVSIFVCGTTACLCICCCCPSRRSDNEDEDSELTIELPRRNALVWSTGLEYENESQENKDLDNIAPPSYDEAVQSQYRLSQEYSGKEKSST